MVTGGGGGGMIGGGGGNKLSHLLINKTYRHMTQSICNMYLRIYPGYVICIYLGC